VNPLRQQFLRFLCVGGSATALQYLLLYLLVDAFGVRASVASGLSYAVSTLYNYVASHYFTFRSQRGHATALPRFLLVAVVGLGLNTTIVWISSERYHLPHYLVAQLLATALTLCWNFFAARHWAFSTKTTPTTP